MYFIDIDIWEFDYKVERYYDYYEYFFDLKNSHYLHYLSPPPSGRARARRNFYSLLRIKFEQGRPIQSK
jgi:hypothetical protein